MFGKLADDVNQMLKDARSLPFVVVDEPKERMSAVNGKCFVDVTLRGSVEDWKRLVEALKR